MDSTINLLPEKDKQLKRDGHRKPMAEMVEMTKPQDRVFQERVVRMEGVLAFFKNIFRRAPKLPQPKIAVVIPPAPPKPFAAAPKSAAPVTKLETMQDRLPKIPQAPKPSVAPPTGSFFSNLFSKKAKSSLPIGNRPALAVPMLSPTPKIIPPPAPVRRAASWAPPPPPPVVVKAAVPHVSLPPTPAPAKAPLGAAAFPPPPPRVPGLPPRVVTEAQPLQGVSMNVNLVPEQYQPEASAKDRIFAGSFVGGAVLLVALATLGLFFYQQRLQSKVQAIDDETIQVNGEISIRERDDLTDALVMQQRTSDVKRVLDQHVYWDVFFEKLEGVTLPTVAYSTMSVDVAGSVTLAAQAKTYNDVGAQLLTYQRAKDFITDVTISAATKTSASSGSAQNNTPPGQPAQAPQSLVSFSVSMRVDPALFYRR
ncbi:MAG: hypothetical protein AAB424_01590 [Patescibacteria group bacterium]